MLTTLLLYAGLLPLVASALIAFVMRRARAPVQIVWAVATACGFAAAQVALRSQSGFSETLYSLLQPHEAVDWLPHIVLLAMGVSVVMYLAPPHRPRMIALAAAICLAAPVRLLSGNVAHHWSIPEKFANLSLLAATLGIVWLLLSSKGDERPSVLRVPLLVLVAVGTAVVLTLSGVLVYGISSGALGAAVAGTALALLGATGSGSVLQRLSLRGIEGAAGVITFSLGSLIILGHFYAELSILNAGLLFLSLAATAAPVPKILRNGPAWLRVVAHAGFCVVPLAIAVASVSA